MELRKTCANGVEVIAHTNPHLHSFCATVYIRAGSAHEAIRESGITHMMEHCIVRSLKSRFQEDFYALLSRNGIQFDAWTSSIRTEYDLNGSPAGIPLAAEAIRKMFLPIQLSAKEFRLEKDRVLAEMGDQNGEGFGAYIEQNVWGKSPARRSIFGTAAHVKRFSRNQLNTYMRSILVPGNVRLCLTGCINEEDLALLIAAAEAIPMFAGEPAPKELPRPKDFGTRNQLLRCRGNLNYLRFIGDTDPQKCSWAAVDLLREIAFNGIDALFYQELSEKTGLVYACEWPFLEYRDFATTEFGFYFDPARLGLTMKAVDRTINQLQQGYFDLEGKKRAILSQWESLQDHAGPLNKKMLHYLEMTDSPYPPDWERVTKEEVMECARMVFENGTLIIWHTDEWEIVEKMLYQA